MPIRPSSSSRRIVRSERTTGRFYECLRLCLAPFRWTNVNGTPVTASSEGSGAGGKSGADGPWLAAPPRAPAAGRPPARQAGRRRAVAVAVLLALAAGITLGARTVRGGNDAQAEQAVQAAMRQQASFVSVPREIRGVHVTMSLASLRGKLQQYLALPGLNTIELDVKDEDGRVGFVPRSVPLGRRPRAAGPVYNPRRAARLVHPHGAYLIGRVVTFEDPVLAEKHPELAIHTSDGPVSRTRAPPASTHPHPRRGWRHHGH